MICTCLFNLLTFSNSQVFYVLYTLDSKLFKGQVAKVCFLTSNPLKDALYTRYSQCLLTDISKTLQEDVMPYTSFIHPSMYQFMPSNIYWDLFSATCSEERKKLDTDSAFQVLYDLPTQEKNNPPKYTLMTETDAQRTVQEHQLISTKGRTPTHTPQVPCGGISS